MRYYMDYDASIRVLSGFMTGMANTPFFRLPEYPQVHGCACPDVTFKWSRDDPDDECHYYEY